MESAEIYRKPDAGLHPGRHLKPVLILLASTIATEIYTMLDTIMLEYYHGETCVGYYSNPVKIVRMTYTVVIAACGGFLSAQQLSLQAERI